MTWWRLSAKPALMRIYSNSASRKTFHIWRYWHHQYLFVSSASENSPKFGEKQHKLFFWPIPASKFIYRCRGCPIFNEGTNEKMDVIYHPTMFGNKAQGMRFYEESIGYTSASNVCYIDDRLLEMCASSNHHSWASLEGFSETINEFFRNCKLTRVNVERTKLFFSHIKMEKEEADMSDADEETQNWCYWHELLPRQLRYGLVKWHV